MSAEVIAAAGTGLVGAVSGGWITKLLVEQWLKAQDERLATLRREHEETARRQDAEILRLRERFHDEFLPVISRLTNIVGRLEERVDALSKMVDDVLERIHQREPRRGREGA